MDDLLTLAEVAEILRVHPITIYRMVRRHQIPAFKVGSEWRFKRGRLEDWIRQQERLLTVPERLAQTDEQGRSRHA